MRTDVAALYVDPLGPYPKLVEHWYDEKRDARTYAGPWPVVAHPPCQLWVNFAALNWKRYRRQPPAWYPGGSDGGCFRSALDSIERFGGVIEHPAGSHAFEYYGIDRPREPGWGALGFGMWVCEVWQSAYGHGARKRTWLLYAGERSPGELDWRREPGAFQIGWFDRNKPTLSKRGASETPIDFARVLLEIAASAARTRAS